MVFYKLISANLRLHVGKQRTTLRHCQRCLQTRLAPGLGHFISSFHPRRVHWDVLASIFATIAQLVSVKLERESHLGHARRGRVELLFKKPNNLITLVVEVKQRLDSDYFGVPGTNLF
jgi:hypothetical protein